MSDWRRNDRPASKTERLQAFQGVGRVLIRASGSEPVLRVMVEAGDEQIAERGAERLAEAAQAG